MTSAAPGHDVVAARLDGAVRRFLRRLIDEVGDDGVFDAAAGVAFWLLLSLPAALLTALSAVSLLGDDLTDSLRTSALDFIDRVFADRSDTLTASIDGLFDQTRPGILSLSIAVALFTVSRGFAGLIRALDTVYDVEETRNFLHTRALAIGLAVGTLAVIAGTTLLWTTTTNAGWPSPARLAVGGAMLLLWAALMYHFGPNQHTPWRYDVPGAALTAIGWFLLSVGFSWYVSIVGDGNQFVGATGAVLLGLTWLWAACVVFLIGGEVNQLLAERAGVIRTRQSLYRRAWTASQRRRRARRILGHDDEDDVEHETAPDDRNVEQVAHDAAPDDRDVTPAHGAEPPTPS